MHKMASISKSNCFKQAMKDPQRFDAMKKEIQARDRNEMWTLEAFPKGKRAIDSKWVYKIEYKPMGKSNDTI